MKVKMNHYDPNMLMSAYSHMPMINDMKAYTISVRSRDMQ